MNLVPAFVPNKSLKQLTTFGIGGNAKYYTEVSDIDTLSSVIKYCNQANLPYFVLGKGSNTLFNDEGFEGLIIHNKINFCEITRNQVFVGAGYSFSLLGVQTARKGLCGLEFASGIPASVGGAVYMNAGASGTETSDCLESVIFIHENGQIEEIGKEKLIFSYRHSSFQDRKGAIAAARFTLSYSEGARKKQLSIIEYRTKTQPYGEKSAGCVFRNPVNNAAAKLIQECGLKGLRVGGAEVSTMHANFIVNKENAKASDVLELAKLIKDRVKEQKGVDLELEIRLIPFTIPC